MVKMLLCFLKMEAHQLETAAWLAAGQLQSVPSNLAASPVSSRAEIRSWLPSGPKLKANISLVRRTVSAPAVPVCVGHTQPGRVPSGTGVFDPCRQSHQPGLRDPASPLLWARIYCFSTSSEWYGCFCLPGSLLCRISPQEKEERNRKSSKAGEWQERISD